MAEKKQFEEYLDKNLDKAYGFARIYVQNPHDLEDVIYESIERALRNIHTLRDPAMMKQWFYKIIINTALAHIKKKAKSDKEKTDYMDRFYLEDFSQLEFDELLDMLPEDDREIAYLRFNDDLEISDIATKLGMNENTVKTRLYRALGKLKLELSKKGERLTIKKGRSVAKNISLGITVLLISATCVFNLSPALAKAAYDIPIIGHIIKVITLNRFEYKDAGYEAKILVPEIQGLLDAELQERLNSEFRENADDLIRSFEATILAQEDIDQELGFMSIKADYTVRTDNDKILSLDTYIYSDTGNFVIHKFYTINKDTGNLVMLSDLFKPQADYITPISTYIIEEMLRLNKEEEGTYEVGESMFATFTAIKPDQNFYISNDGSLVICFDKYEVAAGVQGSPEFIIPLEVVKDIS